MIQRNKSRTRYYIGVVEVRKAIIYTIEARGNDSSIDLFLPSKVYLILPRVSLMWGLLSALFHSNYCPFKLFKELL